MGHLLKSICAYCFNINLNSSKKQIPIVTTDSRFNHVLIPIDSITIYLFTKMLLIIHQIDVGLFYRRTVLIPKTSLKMILFLRSVKNYSQTIAMQTIQREKSLLILQNCCKSCRNFCKILRKM